MSELEEKSLPLLSQFLYRYRQRLGGFAFEMIVGFEVSFCREKTYNQTTRYPDKSFMLW
ncbi:predicted protein [Sclerotinia sclerotiorum 1980 UF-70]|uniref:Uncharacterized protein n=1 Tax=Sclerotinia sclerotiorum (strain ATCC 18683 / 1980 / Ss-1) TaxID=665079 RepID=A7F4B5_SCLS1|nr:predicted protein [Sclerotinia sclerotiorum 1980 UF-70]EDN97586.1 predicted protein [Sclerotinia sclerotiorum 1980 UF-70]